MSVSDPESEHALYLLLEAIGRGDVSALRDLYQATSSRIYPLCLRIVKNREAAEDVLHEVYIKVWNRAAGFDRSRGSAWAWLAMVARNAAIDRVRARNRRSSLDHDMYLTSRSEEGEPPIDEQISARQQALLALEEVDRLDESTLECVRAAFFEGLTYSEVAEREGLPLGTVKSRIRRALIGMRERMGND